MGTKSITFTHDQEMMLDMLVDSQMYNNQSEAIRASFEDFLRRMEPARRLRLATDLYQKKPVTITRAAEVAGVPFQAMEEILKKEGILRRGKPAALRNRADRPRLQDHVTKLTRRAAET